MEYDMQGFFEKCLDRWTELTGQRWQDLPTVPTPFVDADSLRKNQGIGPLEFRLPDSVSKKAKKKQPKTSMPVEPNSLKEPAPDKVPAGVLQPIAAKVLMKILYGARMARYDLLRAVCHSASCVTTWNRQNDVDLYRLICYINTTNNFMQVSWLGDAKEDLKLQIYADADFAGDPRTQRSTSGVVLALAGPYTRCMLSAASRRQT